MSTPEDIREDGIYEDREQKRREFLEQRSRMGGPEAPEPCDMCDGTGEIGGIECRRCLGTGVQS